MAKSQFPDAPVDGQEYTVNGRVFVCSFKGGAPVFTAKQGGFVAVSSIAQARTTKFSVGTTGLLVSASLFGSNLGAAWFVWSPTSTATDDGALVLQVTGVATGRWVRVYDGLLDSRAFGYPNTPGAATAMQAAAVAANPEFATRNIPFALPKNSELRLGDIRIGHGPNGAWAPNNNNLMIGQFAFSNNTTGYANVAIGYECMGGNTTGINNLAIGVSSLFFNQTGSDSIAIGVAALRSNIAGRNTAVGRSAGDNLNYGTGNTLFGYKALQQTESIGLDSYCSWNTFIGDNCASLLRAGDYNVAMGRQAMVCEPGNGVGSNASSNTFIGSESGRDTLTSQACSALGRYTLLQNRTGIGHVAVGFAAGSSIVGSSGLTAIGYDAGRDSIAGLNTFVGYAACATNTGFSNCSSLGAFTAVTGSNQVQLGDSSTTTYVYGTVQNRSDARDKADVRDTELGLAFVNSLRPVDYRLDLREDYKVRPSQPLADVVKDGSKKRTRFHHGFLAHELPGNFGGVQDHKIAGGEDVMSVGYDEFIAPMVKAIQELTARLVKAELELAELKGK
jgi:hypothetical protein